MTSLPATSVQRPPRPSLVVLLVLCAWASVVVVRAVAPSDIATRDQERVAAYVFDITENGHWLAQDDTEGNFASKPPLFNWLSAVAVLAHGSALRIALSFPSWFATALTALLILACGAKYFGRRAGMWGAILYFASQLGLRQVLLLRTDALFQHLIFVGLLCGFEAVERRRSWIPFWIAGLGSTMTKGPLGVLLAAPVFRLFAGEQSTPLGPTHARRHGIGLLIFIGIGLVWLFAANLASDGRAFHKLIGDELVGHAIGTKDDFGLPFQRWNRPVAWFLTRLAPMSLFAVVGIWRSLRRRSEDPGARRFESCLTWQVLTGLLVFSAASENRFEHLMSIIPAAAVLAGREFARLVTSPRLLWPMIAVVALGVGSHLYLSWFDARTTEVAHSEAIRRLADELAPHFQDHRLLRWDAPRALYVDLGRFEPAIDAQQLKDRLASGAVPLWLATLDDASFRTTLDSIGVSGLQALLTRDIGRGESITVWSNRGGLPASLPPPPPRWITAVLFWALVAAALGIAARRVGRILERSVD